MTSVGHLKETNLIYCIMIYYFDQFYGGSISEGSELQIEVAEFLWRNVQVFTPKISYGNFFDLALPKGWADICFFYFSLMEA